VLPLLRPFPPRQLLLYKKSFYYQAKTLQTNFHTAPKDPQKTIIRSKDKGDTWNRLFCFKNFKLQGMNIYNLMSIRKTPYLWLWEPNLSLKSKKDFPIMTEEPGRRKEQKGTTWTGAIKLAVWTTETVSHLFMDQQQ
jgi:hypothetical protein